MKLMIMNLFLIFFTSFVWGSEPVIREATYSEVLLYTAQVDYEKYCEEVVSDLEILKEIGFIENYSNCEVNKDNGYYVFPKTIFSVDVQLAENEKCQWNGNGGYNLVELNKKGTLSHKFIRKIIRGLRAGRGESIEYDMLQGSSMKREFGWGNRYNEFTILLYYRSCL